MTRIILIIITIPMFYWKDDSYNILEFFNLLAPLIFKINSPILQSSQITESNKLTVWYQYTKVKSCIIVNSSLIHSTLQIACDYTVLIVYKLLGIYIQTIPTIQHIVRTELHFLILHARM